MRRRMRTPQHKTAMAQRETGSVVGGPLCSRCGAFRGSGRGHTACEEGPLHCTALSISKANDAFFVVRRAIGGKTPDAGG